eukprot:2732012-Alexandrium_andersonii.AAC.1
MWSTAGSVTSWAALRATAAGRSDAWPPASPWHWRRRPSSAPPWSRLGSTGCLIAGCSAGVRATGWSMP